MPAPEVQYQRVTSSALPDGAATASQQTAIASKIDAVIAALGDLKNSLNRADSSTGTALTELLARTPALVGGATPVVGPLTNTELRATAVPVSDSKLDVALSTRLKPADTLAAVTTVGTITNAVTVAQSTAANLKVDLSGTAANATAIKVDGSAVTNTTKLVDAAGNNIGSLQSTDGDYHLQSSIIQAVYADSRNSDVGHELTALNSYTYTGLYTSTLGVAGIQVSMYSNQNATVYIDQSADHVNWDLVDTFNYYSAIGNFGVTVQAISNYYRVRVISVATTTGFRINSCLCPIVEVVPRTLDPDGLFQTTIGKITGRMGRVRVSPMGGLRTAESVRLAGHGFTGATVDANYWAVSAPVGTGAAAQANGEMTITTGTPTANSSQAVYSVRVARYVPSLPNFFRGVITAPAVTTGTAGYVNTRRFGAYDVNDGYYFQLVQTNPETAPTLSIVTRKATADTPVASGSFNGDYGATYAPGVTARSYEIWWSNKSAWFFVDDILLHTVTSSTATAVATPSLKVGFQTTNSGGNTAANTLVLRSATISRLGPLNTETTYKNVTGAATTVLKYSAGRLHRVILNSTGGTSTTIYDNTAGSGTIIATLTTGAIASLEYNCPFHVGLTVVSVGAGCDISYIYE
jgi:hypothetical protein